MPTRAQVNMDVTTRFFGVGLGSLLSGTRRAQKANQQLQDTFRQGRAMSEGYASGLSRVAQNLGRAAAAGVGLYQLGTTFSELIRLGLEWNKTLEIGALGIASVSIAVREYTDANGKALPLTTALADAQKDAAKQLRLLRVAGLQTAATTRQLVSAFQESVGVGSAYGLTLDQIRQITIRTTQAALTLGLPLFQINQEIRALLSGDIDRNARVAKALAITPTDIRLAQERNTLFQFLFQKTEAFAVAGEVAMGTYAIILSNLQEAIETFAGLAGDEFFVKWRDGLSKLTTSFFNLSTANVAAPFLGSLEAIRAALGEVADLGVGVINRLVEAWKSLSAAVDKNMVVAIRDLGGAIRGMLLDTVTLGVEVIHLAGTFAYTVLQLGLVQSSLRTVSDLFRTTAVAVKYVREQMGERGLIGILTRVAAGFVAIRLSLFLFTKVTAGAVAGIAAFGGAVTGLANAMYLVGTGTLPMLIGGLGSLGAAITALAGPIAVVTLAIMGGYAAMKAFVELKERMKFEGYLQTFRDIGQEANNLVVLTDQYTSVLNELLAKDPQGKFALTGTARNAALKQRLKLENDIYQLGVKQLFVGREVTQELKDHNVEVMKSFTTERIMAVKTQASVWAQRDAELKQRRSDLERELAGATAAAQATPGLDDDKEARNLAKRVKREQRDWAELGTDRWNELQDREIWKDKKGNLFAPFAKRVASAVPVFERTVKAIKEDLASLADAEERVAAGLQATGAAQMAWMTARESLTESLSRERPKAPPVDVDAIRSAFQVAQQQTLEDTREMAALWDDKLSMEDDKYKAGNKALGAYFIDQVEILKQKRDQIAARWKQLQDSPELAAFNLAPELKKDIPKLTAAIDKSIGGVEDEFVRAGAHLRSKMQEENFRLQDAWAALTDIQAKSLPLDQQIGRLFAMAETRYRAEIITLRQLGREVGQAGFDGVIRGLVAKDVGPLIEAEFAKVTTATRARIEEITQLQVSGALVELSARRRIADAYSQELLLLEDIRKAYEMVGAADPTSPLNDEWEILNRRIAESVQLSNNLAIELKDLRQAAIEGLQQGIGDTLKQLGIEIQTLQQALESLALGFFTVVRDAAAKLISQETTQQVLNLVQKLKGPGKRVETFIDKVANANLNNVTAGLEAPALIVAGKELSSASTSLVGSAGALELVGVMWQKVAADLIKAAAALAAATATSVIKDVADAAKEVAWSVSFAGGGFIQGPGTGTSDSIPARLSHGEYVIKASTVRAMGVGYFDALNGMINPEIRRPRFAFASGGLVTNEAAGPRGGQFGITVGLEEGLIARAIQSREGQASVLRVLNVRRKNARQILD